MSANSSASPSAFSPTSVTGMATTVIQTAQESPTSLIASSLVVTASIDLATVTSSSSASTPSSSPCHGDNWDRGVNALDPDAPPKPWPVAGQLVYIQDPNNYCINLPDPKDSYLIENWWSKGVNPTFVQAEGHVRSHCVGTLAPGALPMPPGAVKSLHIRKNQSLNGKAYHQLSGSLDCQILNMTCTGDNGGQYDSVPYRNCGKEPYSGVDTTQNPGFADYVEIGGDGIVCMRACVSGQVDGDPCSAKGDTKGCGVLTQGTDDYGDGFTMIDGSGSPVSFSINTVSPIKTSSIATATALATSVASPSGMNTTSKSGAYANAVSVFAASVMFAWTV
ncbi:hypothetical protein BC830DRAFT_1130379 [Chytriomyces sp. MP71]|nr:hypothetical protein BC830DRAFT_1130379 [Chytriomyces sp. MP71]